MRLLSYKEMKVVNLENAVTETKTKYTLIEIYTHMEKAKHKTIFNVYLGNLFMQFCKIAKLQPSSLIILFPVLF